MRSRAAVRAKHARYRAKHSDMLRAKSRAYYSANSAAEIDRRRKNLMVSKYGITVSQYDEMLLSQGGVCAICLRTCSTGKRLAVDHRHSDGAIRGLACSLCNLALGSMRDDPAILRRAAAYLERHAPAAAIPQTFS